MDAALAIALTALVVASATLFIAWQQLRTARESRGRSLDVGCWPRGQHFADGEVTLAVRVLGQRVRARVLRRRHRTHCRQHRQGPGTTVGKALLAWTTPTNR